MSRSTVWMFASCCLALSLLAALPVAAQTPKPDMAPATAGASVSGLRAEVLGELAEAEQKLIALAEATPADKLGWRPGAGVRSTIEVYLHVSAGNYFIPTFWGVKPPEGLGDLQKYDQSTTDKAKAIDALKASFAHVKKAISSTPDTDLERAIDIFGHKSTVRAAMLITVAHAHEHLGQAIAYARVGGIVPPWSRKE